MTLRGVGVSPPPNRLARAGTYETIAHGTVQRFVCRHCGKGMGMQTESMHYYAKRRLELSGELVFDGLVSAVTSHDFPSQIQTIPTVTPSSR